MVNIRLLHYNHQTLSVVFEKSKYIIPDLILKIIIYQFKTH